MRRSDERSSLLALTTILIATGTVLLAGCGPFCQSGEEELVGPIWTLTTLEGEPLLAGASITAQFSEDGSLGGSAGCNSYSAPHELDGNKLSIGPAISTMMPASPRS
jgi:heat shock protein HslJ